MPQTRQIPNEQTMLDRTLANPRTRLNSTVNCPFPHSPIRPTRSHTIGVQIFPALPRPPISARPSPPPPPSLKIRKPPQFPSPNIDAHEKISDIISLSAECNARETGKRARDLRLIARTEALTCAKLQAASRCPSKLITPPRAKSSKYFVIKNAREIINETRAASTSAL